jgi:hypothetical protein
MSSTSSQGSCFSLEVAEGIVTELHVPTSLHWTTCWKTRGRSAHLYRSLETVVTLLVRRVDGGVVVVDYPMTLQAFSLPFCCADGQIRCADNQGTAFRSATVFVSWLCLPPPHPVLLATRYGFCGTSSPSAYSPYHDAIPSRPSDIDILSFETETPTS